MPATQGGILLAVSPQARARLESFLADRQAVWVQTSGELRAAADRERFPLVIVGSHFDESSTFEIIAYLRGKDPSVRIACVRGRPFPGRLGESTMKAFRAACDALSVEPVIDLLDYPDDAAGERAIRELLESLVGAGTSPRAAA